VASAIGLSARESTKLEQAFGDGVSMIAALLAFLELGLSIVFFAIASRRVNAMQEEEQPVRRRAGFQPGQIPNPFTTEYAWEREQREARNPKA
jgi:hypothetical protein